jgi:1-acyl-sn-glycerol-3-phosphate acyltransferase
MLNIARGVLSATLFAMNCLFSCGVIYILGAVKFIFPAQAIKNWCSTQMVTVAENWISFNSAIFKILHNIKWRFEGHENLRHDRSYLICSNHLSGTDIVVLQEVFNHRIPFLRFFIKHQLRYVPLLGFAWKALDFPMMKRYSAEFLRKHPEKRKDDLMTLKRISTELREKQISILNFMEGTRLTPTKQSNQNSPYKNLLKPKVGGLAFMLEAMGNKFHSLLDVTIYYPKGTMSIWDMMCGRMTEVYVHVREVEIPAQLRGDSSLAQADYRTQVNDWVQNIWQHKDQLLTQVSKRNAP